MSSRPKVIKIVTVGGPLTGKTSLVRQLCGKGFDPVLSPGIGVDFHSFDLSVELEPVKGTTIQATIRSQLWDLPGTGDRENPEPWRRVPTSYLRGSHLVLLCADLSDATLSLSRLDPAIGAWKGSSLDTLVAVLVGTKADLLAAKEGSPPIVVMEWLAAHPEVGAYYETSAKDDWVLLNSRGDPTRVLALCLQRRQQQCPSARVVSRGLTRPATSRRHGWHQKCYGVPGPVLQVVATFLACPKLSTSLLPELVRLAYRCLPWEEEVSRARGPVQRTPTPEERKKTPCLVS